MIKRLISGALSLLICSSMFTLEGIGQKPKSAAPQADNPVSSDMDYKISSTNSLGNYISDAMSSQNTLNASASNVQVNSGYAINNFGFDTQTGEVVVKSTQPQNCTVLVTILEEETNKKACEVKAEVEKGENVITTAKIDISLLPQYYVVKVELVDKKGKSLCSPFTKNTYTKEMQEIIATDIHDFDEEYVVNFDESEETNFLVLSEDTVKAESTDETNMLSSADYENGIFVFDNADETLKNLEEGESLFIQPNENDIIAVSVDKVEINENNQLVIEGNDDNIDEMFEFIKFESSTDDVQTIVDTSVADEGISFPELDDKIKQHTLATGAPLNFQYSNKKAEAKKTEAGLLGITIPLDFGKEDAEYSAANDAADFVANKKIFDVSTSGNLKFQPTVNFYKKGLSVQIEFALEVGFELKASFGLEKEWQQVIDNDKMSSLGFTLAKFTFVTSVPGIRIDVEPKIVVNVSASITITVKSISKFGFVFDSKTATFNDISEVSPLDYSIEVEGKFEVKLVFNPSVVFISKKIAYATFEAAAGVAVTATSEVRKEMADHVNNSSESGDVLILNKSDDSTHGCMACWNGTFDFIVSANVGFSFMGKPFDAELIKLKFPLGALHISSDTGFGWGECDYERYRVLFDVFEEKTAAPISGAVVTLDGLENYTDSSGYASYYCDNTGSSSYKYSVKIGDKTVETGYITVKDAEQIVHVIVSVDEDDEGNKTYSGADSDVDKEEPRSTAAPATKPVMTGVTVAKAQPVIKQKILSSGKLGDNIDFILHDDGNLWIYGYGDMYDNLSNPFKYPESVKVVDFEHEDEKNGLTINSIGNNVFKGCKNLPEITIPDTITRIGEYAFQNCSSLKGFNIPSSVKVIEDYAFANTGYVDVVIPSTVTTLGDYLFSGSTSLKTAVIEDRASLPNYTFNKCTSLEEITLPYAGTTLESVNKEDSSQYIVGKLFIDRVTDKTYAVYNSDRFIRYVPNSLKKIIIKGGTRIPSHAFDGFEGVTEFVLPDTITSIGDYAFQNCSSMPSNPMPEGVKIIGNYAYEGCKLLKTFTVPSSVETIGEGAFANCTGFTNITVPESIVTLGDRTFSGCTSLKKAEIKPVEKIGSHVFNKCTSLEEITLPYAGTTLESVNKEGSSEYIVEKLFIDNVTDKTYQIYNSRGLSRYVPNSLKKIIITGGTRIPSHAFHGFSGVTEIVIPDTITSIGSNAFKNCTGFQRITFNGDAPSISSNAFTNVNTTAYYNKENKTWTDDVKQNYGGNITWHGIELLEITKQPTNGVAPAGVYADVIVEAKGEGLKYKWYIKNKGALKFQPTSSFENKTTYSVSMNDARDGRQIYCVITDKYGNSVQSETVTLYMGNPVEITEQTEIVVVPSGTEAKATIKAEGVGLTYKWYYKNKSDSKFYYTKTFDNMKTYSVKMSDSRDGRQVYCVVTDKYGKSEQSEVITLYMGNPLTITKQPVNTSAEYGSEAKVKVDAKGDGLTYKWYYKNKDDSKFRYTKTFDNMKVYSVDMNEARDGRQVYCEITDKYGVTIQTEIVTLGLPVAITEDLVNTAAELGEKVELSVSATGHGLTYEWYYKNSNMRSFALTKYFTTNTYSLNEMTESRSGREVYCLITDIFGNSVQTETVTIGLPVEIIEQPVNTSAEYGSEAKVRVTAEGDGLTYKWYYKNKDDSKFRYTKTFDNMKTYSVEMNEARDGRQIYCEITDKYGVTIQTETVTIGLPVEITEDLVDVTAELGEKVELSVSATGHGLTYEWHFKNKNMKKFDVTESFKTNTYSLEKMTEARAGREVYCVITDIFGNSVQTETVTIGLPAAAEDTLVA